MYELNKVCGVGLIAFLRITPLSDGKRGKHHHHHQGLEGSLDGSYFIKAKHFTSFRVETINLYSIPGAFFPPHSIIIATVGMVIFSLTSITVECVSPPFIVRWRCTNGGIWRRLEADFNTPSDAANTAEKPWKTAAPPTTSEEASNN